MRIKHAAMVAGLVLGLVSGAAHASIVTYDVAGIFAGGQTLSGFFTVDNSKSTFDQYSNIDINVTGLSKFNGFDTLLHSDPDSGFGEFGVEFTNSSSDRLRLDFNANHNGFDLISIPSENLNTIADNANSTTFVNNVLLVSGTISPAMSPVPLPASAPLYGAGLIALGAAGYAAKRNKAATGA